MTTVEFTGPRCQQCGKTPNYCACETKACVDSRDTEPSTCEQGKVEMTNNELLRLKTWIDDPQSKPAHLAFTAGTMREIADEVARLREAAEAMRAALVEIANDFALSKKARQAIEKFDAATNRAQS